LRFTLYSITELAPIQKEVNMAKKKKKNKKKDKKKKKNKKKRR